MVARIEVQILGDILNRLEPGLYQDPVRQALTKSALVVERKAKERAPSDTGGIRRNITHEWQDETTIAVGNDLDYAPYVHGYMDEDKPRSAPHWPPFGPGTQLARWADRHGIPPFLVARAISKHGTALTPYLRTALEDSQSEIEGFLSEAGHVIESRFGGGG